MASIPADPTTMQQSFTDILQATCQAVSAAFARSRVARDNAGDLQQIGPRERQYDVVAAVHYGAGDLRRIILGCDRSLAQAFGPETVLPAAEAPADLAEESDPARLGLGLFAANLQRALAPQLALADRAQGFLLHDSSIFRVRAQGARNFLLRAPTAAGNLHVLVDLEPRAVRRNPFTGTGLRSGSTIVDTESDMGIVDPEMIAKIMAHLAQNEADVELKVSVSRDRVGLLPATVLAGDLDAADHSLVITAAGLGGRLSEWIAGAEIEIVFIVQDKLLQCVCRVEELTRSDLDDSITLPLLRLGFPDRVTYGQRRGAFRIVPHDLLQGTIRRRSVAGENSGGQDFPIRIVDVSFTGIQVIMTSNTLLSGFKWGTPVTGRIELPLPYDAITVPGTVRRLTLLPDKAGRKAVSLGIEFEDDGSQDPDVLSTLRAFVQDHQRKNLEGEVQVTPCLV